MDKTLGQIAFEAVGACAEIPMKWDRLNEESRIGWESVAAAVAAAVKEEDARICDRLGGDIDPRDPDEAKLCANELAAAIRASIKEPKS